MLPIYFNFNVVGSYEGLYNLNERAAGFIQVM